MVAGNPSVAVGEEHSDCEIAQILYNWGEFAGCEDSLSSSCSAPFFSHSETLSLSCPEFMMRYVSTTLVWGVGTSIGPKERLTLYVPLLRSPICLTLAG